MRNAAVMWHDVVCGLCGTHAGPTGFDDTIAYDSDDQDFYGLDKYTDI